MPENNRKMQTDISELENGQLAEQQLEIQIGKGCQLGAKQILISGYRGTQ